MASKSAKSIRAIQQVFILDGVKAVVAYSTVRYHSYEAKKASLAHGYETSPSRNKSSDSKEESKATNELLEGETATERE